jgi:anti-anti-sigma factor
MDDISIEHVQDCGDGALGVKVSGDLGIQHAAAFREALLRSLEAPGELQVDLSGITGIDLTGLQLLCAAHQSAGQAGKCLQITDGDNAVFRTAAAAAGFVRHVGCARENSSSCIWVRGEK